MMIEILNLAKYKSIRFTINTIDNLSRGIVFIYPSWSIDKIYLTILLDCMIESKSDYPLFVLDIDDESNKLFEQMYNILNNGKGEIYLIIDNKIKSSICKHNINSPIDEIKLLLNQ